MRGVYCMSSTGNPEYGGEHAKIYARANYDMAAEVSKLKDLLYGG